MTTKTQERRAIGDALNSIAAELQTYAPFTIGRVTIHLDAGQFAMEIIDQLGYVDALNNFMNNTDSDVLNLIKGLTYSACGATFDDAFIALAHELAGTEEAQF